MQTAKSLIPLEIYVISNTFHFCLCCDSHSLFNIYSTIFKLSYSKKDKTKIGNIKNKTKNINSKVLYASVNNAGRVTGQCSGGGSSPGLGRSLGAGHTGCCCCLGWSHLYLDPSADPTCTGTGPGCHEG